MRKLREWLPKQDDREVIKRNVRDYPWFTLGDFLRSLWVTTMVFHLVAGIVWGFILGWIWLGLTDWSYWVGFTAGILGMLIMGVISAGMNTLVYVKAYREVKEE